MLQSHQLFCNIFSLIVTIFDAIQLQHPNTKKKPRTSRASSAVAYWSPKPSRTGNTVTLRQPCCPLALSLGVLNEKRHPSEEVQRGWGFHFIPEQNSNTLRIFLSFTMPSTREHNCPTTRSTNHHSITFRKRLALLSTTQNQL